MPVTTPSPPKDVASGCGVLKAHAKKPLVCTEK
jgi:hypothetical protein